MRLQFLLFLICVYNTRSILEVKSVPIPTVKTLMNTHKTLTRLFNYIVSITLGPKNDNLYLNIYSFPPFDRTQDTTT